MSAGHVAVVLAAGGSRRLGRSKQLLTCAGEPLVRRAARLALATAPARVLVIVGAEADAVSGALGELPVETVVNPDWAQGLSASLRVAAETLAARAGACLVLGCDQPVLAAQHLRRLLVLAQDAASGSAGTVHGDGLGVPAVVPVAWLDDRAPGARGDQGLRAALRALPAADVGRLEAPELQLDIDTPEQLRAAIAVGWVDPTEPVQ